MREQKHSAPMVYKKGEIVWDYSAIRIQNVSSQTKVMINFMY